MKQSCMIQGWYMMACYDTGLVSGEIQYTACTGLMVCCTTGLVSSYNTGLVACYDTGLVSGDLL
jgi:hypothetical protein